MKKEEKILKLSKEDQYKFWYDIAYCTDGTITGATRLQAFDKLCDLCGTPKETARKWVLTLKSE